MRAVDQSCKQSVGFAVRSIEFFSKIIQYILSIPAKNILTGLWLNATLVFLKPIGPPADAPPW